MTPPASQLVVFGTGPVAEIVHFYLTHDSPFEVVAFTADREHVTSDTFRGLPVVPFDTVSERYPPDRFGMFVAIGYSRMNKVREARYHQAKEAGYELATYISTKATTWPGAVIGDNCFLMEDVIVHPFVEIGNDIIVWSGSHIGHGTVIGDHCFVSSRTAISGNVRVEPNCFFGTNSTIRDLVTIARESVIGAGAVVLKSTQERGVYVAPMARLLPTPSDRLPNL
jgi:sugar O-acyltransferase (sialic acid O-acetyltransferase NeuD family)